MTNTPQHVDRAFKLNALKMAIATAKTEADRWESLAVEQGYFPEMPRPFPTHLDLPLTERNKARYVEGYLNDLFVELSEQWNT